MKVDKITSKPVWLCGRKFIEKTFSTKYNGKEFSVTTTSVDDTPIIRQYIIKGKDKLEHYVKVLRDLVIS